MIAELRVRDLGVIDDLSLVLGPGLTALTGETGAGKTLVVEAIELLVGGRADPTLVRPGAAEASVEGRFPEGGEGGDDLVLARVVPADGRSRAYRDGRMAGLTALSEAASALVDLHGQHSHQSLLAAAAQRAALDAAGGVDTGPLAAARRRLRQIDVDLEDMGGDPRLRAREMDLLSYQLGELDAAGLDDTAEEDRLSAEQQGLAGATSHRQAAAVAHQALAGDDGVVDRLGAAIAAVSGHGPLAALESRLRSLAADAADVAYEFRSAADSFEDDPARLAAVNQRLSVLGELRRKFGDTLSDVIAERERIRARLEELSSYDRRSADLHGQRAAAATAVAAAERRVEAARRAAVAGFSRAVEHHLRTLAMPRARFTVDVDGTAGEHVTWMLAANPGGPPLPLAKVASGGELARTMLATRLALLDPSQPSSAHPPTLVFDEVDAGIGGEAAVAVGRALAALGARQQVLVVTHLPQVAAFADHQVAVAKDVVGNTTCVRARPVVGDERVAELSRMLSGRPSSGTAREHAAELLASAAGERHRVRAGNRSPGEAVSLG
jgi:DNA repair protein RecN (Recombination protein N)